MSGKKQSPQNYIPYKCQICGFETTNFGLGMHLCRSHKNISYQDYYDKYIDEKEHTCTCGQKLKFNGLMYGYALTCGDKKCITKIAEETRFKNTGYRSNFENPKNIEKGKQTYFERTGYYHSNQNPESKQRRKETLFQKHGVENPGQIPEGKEKRKKTCLNKYGYESHLQSPEIIEKRQESLLQEKGVTNVFQLEEVKEKSKQTKLEKHNNEKYNNKEKREQTNIERYDNKYRPFTKEEREKGNKTKRDKAFLQLLNSDRLKDRVIPKFNINEYKGVYEDNLFECTNCHHDFLDNMKSGKIPRCLICYPVDNPGISLGEQEVVVFLKQYTQVEPNKRFYEHNKYKYEIDAFLPEFNLGIEYNGIVHHSEIYGTKDKHYHIDKTKYFEKLGIQVIHIFETEWMDNRLLVQSILLSKIGMNKNIIQGRKCELKFIDRNVSNEFLNNNHIQQSCQSSIQIGLFYKTDLVSVMTFGKSRFNKQYDFELLRYCTLLNTSIIGGFSKCLKFFKQHYTGSIISYADKRFSKGDIYLKNGFIFKAESEPNYFYFKRPNVLENRIKYQKHKLEKLLPIYDASLSEWQNMQLNKYDRIWDCGNLIFILE